LAILETAFDPNNANVAVPLHSLALLYHAQGRYAEAEAVDQAIFGNTRE
jgi:hypothetical protein